MTPDARLAELDDLLRQLEVRNLHKLTREFLVSRGIQVGMGWSRIKDAITRQRDDDGFAVFVDAFESFVRDSVLVSNKRVYLLAARPLDPVKLAAPAPITFRTDYLSATAPKLGDEDVSWFVEQRQIGRATVTTYVTSRPAKKSEQLDPSAVKDEYRETYSRAVLMARHDVDLRCYDHVVQFDDASLLLLDDSEGIDSANLGKDEANYALLLREQLPSVSADQPIFVDLFPAVESLYRDDAEGIVNWLEFVSNNRAKITGRFSPNSRHNYRDHPFQRGGESSGAIVSPYRIAVKWLDRPGEPLVLLPGKPEMAIASGIDGTSTRRGALHHMALPVYTTWESFVFVLERVRHHLPASGAL